MASILGVSSLYQTPSLELSRHPSPSPLFIAFKPFTSLGPCRCLTRRVSTPASPATIATPNSVLSEEAFKGLRDFSALDSGEEEEDVGTEGSSGDKNDLAITNLGLPHPLVDSLFKRGITHLFPIQRAILILALEGRDIISRAKTGTGKTLAFGIPIIRWLIEDDKGQNVSRRSGRLPRVLVLALTRELAKQVKKQIKESASYLSTVCIYGGVSYNIQQNALTRGVVVAVGTPGRIIDLINSGSL